MIGDTGRERRAVRAGNLMLGPVERERCERHKRRWRTFRWVWRVGEDISSATPDVVRPCAECVQEDQASWLE